MSVLNCRYYGFECNFEIKGDIKKIVNKMQQHAIVEHKVDLTKEFLSQMILRKISWYCEYCNNENIIFPSLNNSANLVTKSFV